MQEKPGAGAVPQEIHYKSQYIIISPGQPALFPITPGPMKIMKEGGGKMFATTPPPILEAAYYPPTTPAQFAFRDGPSAEAFHADLIDCAHNGSRRGDCSPDQHSHLPCTRRSDVPHLIDAMHKVECSSFSVCLTRYSLYTWDFGVYWGWGQGP